MAKNPLPKSVYPKPLPKTGEIAKSGTFLS